MAKINKWSQRPLMAWVQKSLPLRQKVASGNVGFAPTVQSDCQKKQASQPAIATPAVNQRRHINEENGNG